MLRVPALVQAWLNPAEAYFTAPPMDGLSSVEVCGVEASPPSFVLAAVPSGPPGSPDISSASGSSSSSSFYTNIGYFLSSSSGSSAPSMRRPTYFSYPDDGNGEDMAASLCSSFGKTRSSESLEQEPQSPDSGFSFGKEDEEAEKKDPEVPEEQVCPLLVFPCPAAALRLSPAQLSSGDSAEGSSVCRSSSMNAQPCRTGYLTLKELHMTFSNKSI